jgi:arylsulfatase A-like enzyme
MVENLDIQIGRLIVSLEEADKIDNTMIIYTSDNGGHYPVTKQRPLRAGKGSYYEGGIREPMFVWWPGEIEAETISETPVTNIDFYPTLMEILNIELPDDLLLDGNSILPVLKGNDIAERPLVWHFPVYLENGSKETQDPLFRTRPGSAVRLGNWKLIEYFENGDMELYNLKYDIGEENNLAQNSPEKLKELQYILDDWRTRTSAPIPVELNPSYIN